MSELLVNFIDIRDDEEVVQGKTINEILSLPNGD